MTITGNGVEALRAYESAAFDVILMDIQMPMMDGLTAHALAADKERSLAVSMDCHVAKPFNAAKLMKLMEELTASRITF